MSKKLYALLIGINDYPEDVGKLYGCCNDVNHMQDYLQDHFKSTLLIESLKNNDATRNNIIKLSREHLGKAGENDAVLFYYSGHGSREMSAPGFKEFYPDSLDETLVCYDSRLQNGFDLADKELAALLAEIAQKNPHIAVILDCCHSGSGTRAADDFNLAAVKQIPTWKPGTPRPLESYFGGYKDMTALRIPLSKHILMAACDRKQKAWETNDRSGVFTDTLLEVLEKSKGNISYTDLFFMCRSAVLKRAQNQTPQFEPYHHFLPYTKFLQGDLLATTARYHVFFEEDEWKIDCGALHGLPTDTDKNIEIALFAFGDQGALLKNRPLDPHKTFSNEGEIAGYTRVLKVGAQKSTLDLKADNTNTQYKAEIISLPVPPLPVLLEGDEPEIKRVRESLNRDKSWNFNFPEEPGPFKYSLSAQPGRFLIKNRETDRTIQGAEGDPEACIQYVFSSLEKIQQWERRAALQNHNTSFYTELVDFRLFEILDKGEFHEYKNNEITLDYVKQGDTWKNIKVKLRVRNQTKQELHFALCYFSEDYKIKIFRNDPVPPEDNWVTLWGDHEEEYLDLAEEADEGTDIFKLLVSTEKVDNFLLELDDLEIGKIKKCERGGPTRRAMRDHKKITDDWFTKTITVRTVRQLTRVGEADVRLANGQIIVKGHPSFKANLCLTGSPTHTRGLEHETMEKVFSGEGFIALRFAATRGEGTRAEGAGVLELSDICQAESLKENPLEILLDTPLKEHEYLLPLTFDGDYFLPVGNPVLDENRRVTLRIRHIPEIIDVKRRSLGKALKLCFYKLFLEPKNINKLCWVEYKPNGDIVRHEDGLKEKVAAAENIILVIHGIIGDTKNMAKGLKTAMENIERNIATPYDLVLSFDYENLNTPIQETARLLMEELRDAGIHEEQGKKITILAHSMGGLVSRWLIEKEDGNKIVKHLIMAGPPNNGSVFGEIWDCRKVAMIVLSLTLNFVKYLSPFACAFWFAMHQAKGITVTLEQMQEGSRFLRNLETADDPGVKYTILAGDITNYEVTEKGFFPRLLEKIETGIGKLAYAREPNDIAVSVESIKKVDDRRKPGPEKIDLVCHHLNYFAVEAGLKALKKSLAM